MKCVEKKQKLQVFFKSVALFVLSVLIVGNVVDIYQREFLALRDRLHSAEQENLKRSKELNLVLDEIKRAIAEKQALRDINRTWSSLSGQTQSNTTTCWTFLSTNHWVELKEYFTQQSKFRHRLLTFLSLQTC